MRSIKRHHDSSIGTPVPHRPRTATHNTSRPLRGFLGYGKMDGGTSGRQQNLPGFTATSKILQMLFDSISMSPMRSGQPSIGQVWDILVFQCSDAQVGSDSAH